MVCFQPDLGTTMSLDVNLNQVKQPLTHPKERKKKTYGTVPIVQLCLKNVHVLQGNFTMPHGGGSRSLSLAREKLVYHAIALNFEAQLKLSYDLNTKNTVVLFPDLEEDDIFLLKHPELRDKGAINLGLKESQANADEEDVLRHVKHLVVIDGTWAQAKSMYRSCSFLHGFRRVQFAGGLTGKYIFRKEPKHNYLSTLESIAHCLPFLERQEPEQPCLSSVLLQAFTAMVSNQLQFVPDRTNKFTEAEG
ncbi:hypothetical protein GUITHDRAFT_120724 [Guillardia theta CCMP2712]|uniref:tRNA-uridine aminocarboxypropyltransferase n=1 Tax=Guillardia theta (strain CCMP2712) TaxID=905079 RepID=L1IB86_GUITC|nr:hypothetical protein GUITHDRAFT_120724 [Guillardia theta CCMP2712]EKX33110.1 hypothetical protein GUITHDRAFT_120724 [Guillardia theta CCMP2712]|eukprot:XP_005820090.1 hypothetical protein GUITHDRAFT_120724 [Guillardia theta CCMP2712]